MNPRKFLDVARRLLTRSAEEDWRTAANRAYYAAFLECRNALTRWGFTPPKSDRVHGFVRDRFFLSGNADLIPIGHFLGQLGQTRNKADYNMPSSDFGTKLAAQLSADQAADALLLLDALNADPAKRAAAIADIRSRWP